MELQKIVIQVNDLVRSVGSYILAQREVISGKDIETKSLNSFVSYVDREAENKLVASLQEILPEAGFITEEETIKTERKEYNWIVDPLDGTTNYLHGIPVFAISVALVSEEEELVGVVHELGNDELFHAFKDGGAFCNGSPIQVSGHTELKDALMATGFPYYDFTRMDEYLALLRHFFRSTRGVRRLGSAATDLAYVASGRFDGFFEYGLNAWDVAAGALLVKEAGGEVTDFSYGKDYIFGKEILAYSPGLSVELHQAIETYLNGK